MYKKVALIVLFILIAVICFVLGLPILIHSFSFDVNLVGRIAIVRRYVLLISLMYYIKKNTRIDLQTSLSYSHNFNVKKNASKYLNYMFNCSLFLFLPIIALLVMLQYMGVNGRFDFCFLLISLFIWISLGYSKSIKLS